MVYIRPIFNLFRRLLSSMRVLNVAEKNEAAKNIASILSRGRSTRREGYSKFNKIYEFPMTLNGVNCSFIMTSVSGHLLNYEFSQCFRSWESCNPLALFDAPLNKKCTSECEPIKRTLEREIKSCSHLIIWTDCDREGENIGYEIFEVCQRVKSSIIVSRARFSEITPAAITRAVNNLTTIDERVSQAVDARQELDLRIGAAFTRFQTLRLKRVFPRALAEQLISYGSCQFPTLGFVVERFREVEAFISEPFWKISVEIVREEGNSRAIFQWKRGRIFDQACCAAYHEQLLENPIGQIIDVQQKPKSKWRPLPMDTVEMEKLASRKLRIGAKETMQLAESLYTKGYISYPRTETNSFPPDLKLHPLVEAQTQDSRWAGFAQKLLTSAMKSRNGKKTDQAHPPIHPLKAGTNLQGNEARLYELITRHFLACLSEDAKGAETTVRLLLGAADAGTASPLQTGEVFEARGLVIHSRNYLDVYYPYEGWNDRHMPAFNLGEIVTPDKIEMTESRTTAPSLLTEADLIALMDKHGIGTDATHAEHIETVKKRLYVGLQDDKFLVPSQLGMGLIEGYDSMDLAVAKPCLRAELEFDLKAICDGRKSKEDVLRVQLAKYKSAYERVMREAQKLDIAISKHLDQEAVSIPESTDVLMGGGNAEAYQKLCPCPSCGKDVVIRQRNSQDSNQPIAASTQSSSNRLRWFFSCSGFPTCKYAIWLPDVVVAARVIAAARQGVTQVNPTVSCASIDGEGCQGGGNLVGFKFRLGTMLPCGYVQEDPHIEYVTCIFCDEEFRMAFGVRTAAISNTTVPPPLPLPQPPPPSLQPRQPNRRFSTMSSSTRPAIPLTSLYPQSGDLASSYSGNASHSEAAFGADDSSNPVVCSCGIPARLLTVRKPGPNKGKTFYKCGETSDVCNFFLWKDSFTGDTSNPSLNGDSGVDSASSSSREVAVCSCGLPAVRKTVSQATANRGRQFFVCANSTPGGGGGGCRFFQWADAAAVAATSGRQPTRPTDRRSITPASSFVDVGESWPPTNPLGGAASGYRRNRGSGGGGGARKCSMCHLPGHTRNRCPSTLQG